MTVIPDSHRDLLERPLFVHLGIVRPDGTPQVNPMWCRWDGEFLYFTTTTIRRKFHHVTANPAVSVSVNDPDAPYRYLEVRGVVERIDPDPQATVFLELANRYGMDLSGPPGDAAHRVVLVVRPTATSQQ